MNLFCTNCGKEISKDANFCRYCGHQVTTGDLKIETPKNENGEGHVSRTEEVVANDLEREPKLESTDLPLENDLSKFVGKNYDYYYLKWSGMDNSAISWNFASFFCSLFWLGYRKMYGTVFLIAFL